MVERSWAFFFSSFIAEPWVASQTQHFGTHCDAGIHRLRSTMSTLPSVINLLRPLRDHSLSVRLGLLGVVLVIAMGHAASLLHMYWHYENRDERPGFTIDDVRAAYHGINAPALFKTALENDHPKGLAQPTREALLAWLATDKIAENYDNLDLGDNSPAELIAANCNTCHARKVAKEKGANIPLEAWEDVRKVVFSRTVNPVPIKVLAISTHTHALSLAALSGVVIALSLCCSFARAPGVSRVVGALVAANGIGLTLDIASWWITRSSESFVYVIVVAGGFYNFSLAMLTLLIAAELVRLFPRANS